MKKIKKSRFRLYTMTLAIAFSGGGMFASSPAQALAIINTYNFSGSANVTDNENTGSPVKAANNNASLGSTAISQFNPSSGVLTGVTVNLVSTQTQSTQTTSTAGGGSGANSNVTSNGTANSTVKLEGAGISFQSANLLATDACAGRRKDACSDGTSVKTQSVNTSASPSDLNSFTGTGDITLNRTATTLEATQSSNVFTGTESTKGTVSWDGQIQVTYDYLLHAAPSFNGSTALTEVTLDFGTVNIGDAVPSLGFSLFNLAGDRVGLDLDGITGSGDTSFFTTDLAAFTGLGAGSGYDHLASFDPSSLGSFSATYVLDLSDADVGAASSRYAFDDYLTLNLRGNVIAKPAELNLNDIPEPGMLALISIGLFGLLGLSRHRRF